MDFVFIETYKYLDVKSTCYVARGLHGIVVDTHCSILNLNFGFILLGRFILRCRFYVFR